MEAKIKTLRFIAADFKEISRVAADVCITHNATFISMQINKASDKYACIFRYIDYL